MKKLWNLIGVVAVVNLTAVIAFVGWLGTTGRLTRETLEKVREALAAPKPADPLTPVALEGEDARDITPLEARLRASDRLTQQSAMLGRRLRDEQQQLARDLGRKEEELVAREAAVARDRAAWEEATREARDARGAEQTRKAVRMLESVPPKQAKEWLLELYRAGNVDQAVAYLDAMTPYKSSGVLKTFKGEEENKVATDLLERLRQRARPAESAAAGATNGRAPNGPASRDSNATAPSQPSGRAAGRTAESRPVANAGAEVDRPGRAGN